MVLECPGCHHSYDVSGYKAGQRLRCHCGQVLVVPGKGPEARAARTLHCSNCGGHLKKGEPNCPFCGALIDLTHARMTAYCTACLSMSKDGATFCSGCGKEIVTKVETLEEATEICPHCQIRMRRRSLGKHRPLECPICCGLFVAVDVFDKLIRDQEQRVDQISSSGGPSQTALKAGPVFYFKCPACGGMMNRINYGRISGVIVDFCREHGYWLDPGELEQISKWVATGGLSKQRAREMEEMKSQKSRHTRTAATSVRMSGNDHDDRQLGSSLADDLINFVFRLFD